MSDRSQAIHFPVPDPPIHDADRGFAIWQTEHGSFASGTLDDFVQARRQSAHRRPGDPDAVRELGRAYLWSGEPDRAIETLAPLHRDRPGDREVQALILDALALLGREPSAFPWTRQPTLVPLDDDLLDRFHECLAAECRPATALDLCIAAADDGHPVFDAGDLVRALQDDPRFLVHPSNLAPECTVVLAKRSTATGRPLCRSEG